MINLKQPVNLMINSNLSDSVQKNLISEILI